MAQNGGSRSGYHPNMSSSGPIAAIMLAGKTGSGKSSFIKLLGGKDSNGQKPISDGGLNSCTLKPTIYMAEISGRRVLLLDTPGFDDSAVDNLTVLNEIVSNLYMFALQSHEVNTQGVIFLHDISETRFGGSQQKTLELLNNLCGEASMQNVIIGTTMWNSEGSRQFNNQVRRENEFLSKHWRGIYKTVRVPDEDQEVALRIVNDLLAKPPTMLLVQREMLVPPHTCENTTAGKIAIPEGKREAKRLQRELEEEQARAAEEARAQEQRHREQQEEDRAAFEAERVKMAEAAQRLEAEFKKREEQEKERQRQHQEQIKNMNEEFRKTAQEAENLRLEREKERKEEMLEEKRAADKRHNDMMERMRQQEKDHQDQMERDRKEYERQRREREEEQKQINERLERELAAAKTEPKKRFFGKIAGAVGKIVGAVGDAMDAVEEVAEGAVYKVFSWF